ncbi:ABC transporter ATP-binding protein [Neobittarella massiliensis]|uniref:ABC transporter ATP-binding protein n=2 Tax=Oscillospiraceae TaxID=216572 RepID=A0A8J6INR0_9FIRM|nr:ABC transporter ATP-binding protein [Neobittarella massiliensis]MBC3515093.1 ABC transporter ATP-binding protein [Neobittarella massiliensis]SCJ64508.1 Bicarbonate transport ATP-binding protein CmpC [uncultured Anaerotruncus sp.]
MDSILKVDHVSQKYQAQNGEVTAIQNITFSVDEGEFISIVGPSGCGKSTLLSIVAGLDRPTYGHVYLAGQPVSGISSQIGYMLQKDNLLEWRTIWRNVLLGLEIRGLLTPENTEHAEQLLKTYELYEFRDKYPSQLSGGMRQRAALIRTLAVRPQILLLDEAFSALDYQTRLTVTDDIYQILKREHKTTLMVTHDIPEAISMSDRIVVLSARPATVKNTHIIEFEPAGMAPLQRRNNPKFSHYFNLIWKELDQND